MRIFCNGGENLEILGFCACLDFVEREYMYRDKVGSWYMWKLLVDNKRTQSIDDVHCIRLVRPARGSEVDIHTKANIIQQVAKHRCLPKWAC